MTPARRALVTGGTGALGDEVVARLRKDGFEVVVAARGTKDFTPASGIAFARIDVTDPASVAGAVQASAPVAALVHLVGAFSGGTAVDETAPEDWDRLIGLNLRSAFVCARAVLPGMLEAGWGRIVFVSSRSARRGLGRNAAYSVAKAGLGPLAEAISEECRDVNVTANVVAPATLDTPQNRAAWPDARHDRWVAPGNVAAAISFLTSEAAGDVRGAWIPVFGSV